MTLILAASDRRSHPPWPLLPHTGFADSIDTAGVGVRRDNPGSPAAMPVSDRRVLEVDSLSTFEGTCPRHGGEAATRRPLWFSMSIVSSCLDSIPVRASDPARVAADGCTVERHGRAC